MFGREEKSLKPEAPAEPKKVVDLKGKKLIPMVTPQPKEKAKGLVMGTPTTWMSGTPYSKNTMVSLEEHTFKSKKNHNLSTPSTSSADWIFVK